MIPAEIYIEIILRLLFNQTSYILKGIITSNTTAIILNDKS